MATTKSGKTQTKPKKKGSAAKTTPRKKPAAKTARQAATVAVSAPPPPVTPPTADQVALDATPIAVTAELGRSRMTLDRALQVSDQSLIELDKSVGDPVDIRINGRLFARGEVVTISENFGVRITEFVDAT